MKEERLKVKERRRGSDESERNGGRMKARVKRRAEAHTKSERKRLTLKTK